MTEQATDEQARFSEAVRRREEREAYLDEGGEAYPEEEEPPRDALLELSRRLRALEEEGVVGLEAETRLAWVLALGPLRTLEQQAAALRFADGVRFRPELPACRGEALAAVKALAALMDALRERAPEHLR